MVGKLVDYGLEHWVRLSLPSPCPRVPQTDPLLRASQGADQVGVNHVRRFVCESLSFTHRYVPVGLLERFPVALNERAFPYRGRDELEVCFRARFQRGSDVAHASRTMTDTSFVGSSC